MVGPLQFFRPTCLQMPKVCVCVCAPLLTRIAGLPFAGHVLDIVSCQCTVEAVVQVSVDTIILFMWQQHWPNTCAYRMHSVFACQLKRCGPRHVRESLLIVPSRNSRMPIREGAFLLVVETLPDVGLPRYKIIKAAVLLNSSQISQINGDLHHLWCQTLTLTRQGYSISSHALVCADFGAISIPFACRHLRPKSQKMGPWAVVQPQTPTALSKL